MSDVGINYTRKQLDSVTVWYKVGDLELVPKDFLPNVREFTRSYVNNNGTNCSIHKGFEMGSYLELVDDSDECVLDDHDTTTNISIES